MSIQDSGNAGTFNPYYPGSPQATNLSFLPAGFDSSPTATVLHQDFAGDFSPAPYADQFSQGAGGNSGKHPGGGGGGGGGSAPPPWTSPTVNGITFVVDWDSSVGSAPQGFVSGFETAVGDILGNLSGTGKPITITLNAGWGEAGGSSLSPFALGESLTNINQASYSSLTSSSLGSYLPAADPISSTHTYWVASAEEKALGLISNNNSVDGSVGFSSRVNWNFNSTTGTGQYDFVSTAEHEISEVMGRIGLGGSTVANTSNSYSPLDLLRYSAPGQISPSGSSTAYFSFNFGDTSGATNLAGSNQTYFNNTAGGDIGDWASSAGKDAFDAFASSGANYSLSSVDKLMLDALGYGAVTTV